MELKDYLPTLLGIIFSAMVTAFTTVRRVDRLELMIQNLSQNTDRQFSDLKASVDYIRLEINSLDKELQNVKERLRVLEEKTK
jgi:predicted  nucleic acid-binding Zn-ribbon protein